MPAQRPARPSTRCGTRPGAGRRGRDDHASRRSARSASPGGASGSRSSTRASAAGRAAAAGGRARAAAARASAARSCRALEDGWLPLLEPFPWSDAQARGDLRCAGESLFGIGARLLGGSERGCEAARRAVVAGRRRAALQRPAIARVLLEQRADASPSLPRKASARASAADGARRARGPRPAARRAVRAGGTPGRAARCRASADRDDCRAS